METQLTLSNTATLDQQKTFKIKKKKQKKSKVQNALKKIIELITR